MIKEATGCTTLECWPVDLASFKSVSAFADRFEKEGGNRLDILLQNAGIAVPQFKPTNDGWESTYAQIAVIHQEGLLILFTGYMSITSAQLYWLSYSYHISLDLPHL